jgi:large subunit ribosomal protein L25
MAGMTPAVVYGGGGQATQLQLDTKTLTAKLLEFARRNSVVTLKVQDGGEKNVVVGEVQTDPVTDTLIHVDFCEIDLTKIRQYTVPVIYKGTSKGVDLGGNMVVSCNEVVLKGKPLDIPNECVIDVTALGLGDKMNCGQISVPANVQLLTDADDVAVTILRPVQKAAVQEETKGKDKKKK